MRKKALYFVGMLLMAVSAFAQNEPTLDPDRDAKMIFLQTFEDDWDAWSTYLIDSIYEIEYYNHLGDQSGQFRIWENPDDWQRGLIRKDSVIYLYNNVMPTNDPSQIENNNFPNEQWFISEDNSLDRYEAMSRFGEHGGDYVFSYISDTCTAPNQSWGSYRGGYTANYCRNLFVRGLDIEDETSYRLTFYVKANTLPGHEQVTPRLYADVMRGYVNSEKPFSMGLENNASEYKYNATFAYEKTEFTGGWEKVTFMTYYLNDSIADNFFYSDGYWWGSNEWNWSADNPQNPTGMDLNYIVQPDKFFVRLSFASDFTEFKVDNLSLTKSWIAGAEYYGDKLRVDFGYKTNLSDIASNAYEQNKIAAVEVPGDYFEVWGQNHDGSWEVIPIRSAEYHADGYMYMFADSYMLGGEEYTYRFDDYQIVLVTFHNPVDKPELTLRYTGTGSNSSEVFPKALDTEWIMSGKPVPDFYNEVATSNPNIFDGVYSMKELSPVMQEPFYEDGSFGLDQYTRQLSFQFSREIALNNLLAYVGDEEWYTEWDDNTSSLVITRPAEYTSPLAGDYEINIVNIQGIGTGYGENVTLRYHFGSFERIPAIFYKTTDWKNEVAGSYRPYPTSIYIHSGQDPFMKGDGSDSRGKCGLYEMNDEGQYNCGFYLSNRVSGNTGNLYSIETLNKGDYKLSFRACGWGSNSHKLVVKLYAKPEGELIDGNENGFAVLEAVADKVEIGRQERWESNISSPGDWPDGSLDLSYNFFIPSDGDYVIEFYTDGSNSYNGVFFSNYSIRGYSDMSQLYTVPLFESIEKAIALSAVAEADSWKYGGYELEQLIAKIDYYSNFTSTAPSQWTAAKSDLDTYSQLVKERMETVDAFYNKVEEATNMYNSLNPSEMWLDEAVELIEKIETANSAVLFPITEKTVYELSAFMDVLDNIMEALGDHAEFNEHFRQLITEAKQHVKDAIRSDYAEYSVLSAVLDEVIDIDLCSSEDVVTNEYIRLLQAKSIYAAKVSGWLGVTKRIKDLRSLAQELGSEVASNNDLNRIVDSLQTDDDIIAEIYTTAIKLAIYEKLADDPYEFDGGLDVTPLLKNYNLYTTINGPVVDRSDKRIATFSILADERKGVKYPESSIMKIQYEYGQDIYDKNIWVLMFDTAYADVFPGWTVTSMSSNSYGNYGIVTPDPNVILDKTKYSYLSVGATVFDGALSMDWNSSAELQTVVEALPSGIYSLGVQLTELSATNSVGTSLSVTTRVGNDSITLTTEATNDGARTLTVDDITVEDGMMDIDLLLRSGSGFSQADNFTLLLQTPSRAVNYNYEASLARVYLDELLLSFTQKPGQIYHDIYMSPASVDAGSQIVIPISLENSSTITAFSLDVVLPNGVSFVSAELNGSRINGHTLSTNVTYNWYNSTVSLACLSMNNNALYNSDGDVVYLTLLLSDDLESDYTIQFNNKEMVSPDNTVYNPSNSVYTLTVLSSYEPGDVNDDGRISIADAVGVVSFIINSNTIGLNRRAADANQDGTIDVADVVWVINRVIGRSYAPSRRSMNNDISSTLTLDYVLNSTSSSLSVNMEGLLNEITAVQFNVTLPDGVKLKNFSTRDSHIFAANRQNDGSYTVVCYSLTNSTFVGGGDRVFELEFDCDDSFRSAPFILNNIKIVTPDCRIKTIDSISLNLSEEAIQTGMFGISNDSDSKLYDLQGRQTDNTNGIFIRDGKKVMKTK